MIKCLNCGKIANKENTEIKECPNCGTKVIENFFRVDEADLNPTFYQGDLEWLH
ncbi:MAG: hypothetical protein ACFFG0_37825 [Candidatus Thorarchaeota archaeon]